MSTKLMMFMFLGIALQNSYLHNVLDPNIGRFHKIHFDVFYVTNSLLSCLKLHNNFTNSIHVQTLLSMLQFHVNNLATGDCRLLENLGNMSFVTVKKPENLSVEALIHNIVAEEIDHLKNIIINETQSEENDAVQAHPNEILRCPGSCKSFHENLAVLNERIINGRYESIPNKRREIKAWRPPNSSQQLDLRRIYKGKKSKIKNYSFLVSIHIMSEFLCAGSIISKDLVVTSASCLQIAQNDKYYRSNPRAISVRAGSDYSKQAGQLIPVVQVIFHPKYDSATLKNNVAILRMLENPMQTKKRKVKRIKYDNNADVLAKNVKGVTILGWGINHENQKLGNMQKLKKAELDIYDIEDCQEIYSKYYVTKMNFCAGFANKGGGACTGDVGGPAVVDGELIGIISFGPTVCGMTDAPTVFTKIGYYADWIDNIVKQDSSLRIDDKERTAYLKPNLLMVPLFTTPSRVTKPVAKINLSTKINNATKAKKYPEEIHILKKIIHEFILTNSTVLDYLVNGDAFDPNIAESDFDDLFDPDISEEKLLKQASHKPNLRTVTVSAKNKSKTHSFITLLESYEVTQPTVQGMYEFEETSHSNESSYYEEGISIEIPESHRVTGIDNSKMTKIYQKSNVQSTIKSNSNIREDRRLQYQEDTQNMIEYQKPIKKGVELDNNNSDKIRNIIIRLYKGEKQKEDMTQSQGTTIGVKRASDYVEVTNTTIMNEARGNQILDINVPHKLNHQKNIQTRNRTEEVDRKVTQQENSENKKLKDIILRLYRAGKEDTTSTKKVDNRYEDAITTEDTLGFAMNISDEDFDYIDKFYHEEKDKTKFYSDNKKYD